MRKVAGTTWEADFTTFGGGAIGAHGHVYARIRNELEAFTVYRVMDEAAADRFNELDPEFAQIAPCKVGDVTERFDNRADAEAAATALWRTKAGPEDRLIERYSRKILAAS